MHEILGAPLFGVVILAIVISAAYLNWPANPRHRVIFVILLLAWAAMAEYTAVNRFSPGAGRLFFITCALGVIAWLFGRLESRLH